MGLSAKRPNNASTVSTAFVARKVHTIAIGGPGRRTLWQRMGLEQTALSMPVFQYYPEDKACSVWLYENDKSTSPHQKLTWFGVKNLADGQNILSGSTVRLWLHLVQQQQRNIHAFCSLFMAADSGCEHKLQVGLIFCIALHSCNNAEVDRHVPRDSHHNFAPGTLVVTTAAN